MSAHNLPKEASEAAPNYPDLPNVPAQGISYFTPAQNPPAGTAIDQANAKKLFKPLKIRGLTLQNRIFVSPLCQYSSQNGHVTDWQLTHLGGIMQRGPGLTCVEATAVVPEGRITPEDAGLWQDSQIEPWRRVVEFAHSQGQKIMVQLAHAGRKASTVAPWLAASEAATEKNNGWPSNIKAPSALPFGDNLPTPHELSLQDIEDLKAAWVAATRRALKAGFDAIEIHNAHGYLLHEFISPVSNRRTDKYGGSFENRTRLSLEIVDLVRKEIPDTMPLFLRISADDWLSYEGSPFKECWTVNDTVKFAKDLAEHGVDLLDISSGGIHPAQKITAGPSYQAPFSFAVKKAVGDKLLVSAVGSITNGPQANGLLDDGLDAIFIGRYFQKNPGLVWNFAEELEVPIKVANQIGWGFGGRAGKKTH